MRLKSLASMLLRRCNVRMEKTKITIWGILSCLRRSPQHRGDKTLIKGTTQEMLVGQALLEAVTRMVSLSWPLSLHLCKLRKMAWHWFLSTRMTLREGVTSASPFLQNAPVSTSIADSPLRSDLVLRFNNPRTLCTAGLRLLGEASNPITTSTLLIDRWTSSASIDLPLPQYRTNIICLLLPKERKITKARLSRSRHS
jgi:hypothetical protein